MSRKDVVLAIFTILSLLNYGACQAGSKRADSKADAWVGRDASDLLMQLRVDGGRVSIFENEETGETSYTWSTWNPAWTEEVVTGVDTHVVGVVGLAGGAMMPITNQTVYTKDVHHDATHRCDLTFFADQDGIVTRWSYTGTRCGTDIAKPKE